MHDIHPINICVCNAGSQIEVRFIDFVIWKKEPRNEPSYYSDILCENATHLLQEHAWSTFGDFADIWTQLFVNGHLLRICEGPQVSDVLRVLLEVADGLLKKMCTEKPAMCVSHARRAAPQVPFRHHPRQRRLAPQLAPTLARW